MTEQDLISALEGKGYREVTAETEGRWTRVTYRRKDGEWSRQAVMATGPLAYTTLSEWLA